MMLRDISATNDDNKLADYIIKDVLICSRVRTYLKIGFDMFPRTDKRRKIGMISFRLRTKWQNCRGYVPRYERTPKNEWFDIHSVFATHVETVVLMSRKDK